MPIFNFVLVLILAYFSEENLTLGFIVTVPFR